jgi:hypothetical protein
VLIPSDVIDFTMKSMKDMKKRDKGNAHTIVSVVAQMDATTMYSAPSHDEPLHFKIAILFMSFMVNNLYLKQDKQRHDGHCAKSAPIT